MIKCCHNFTEYTQCVNYCSSKLKQLDVVFASVFVVIMIIVFIIIFDKTDNNLSHEITE